MVRDFTYVDDIVEGLVRIADKPATSNPSFDPANPDPATSSAPYRVFNIGNSQPTPLMDYISALGEDHIFATKRAAIATIFHRLDKDVCARCNVRLFDECQSLPTPVH